MEIELATYLASYNIVNRELWDWGEIQLESHLYLMEQHPPQRYVTSIRSIVFKGDNILVLRNPNETHILPGGRRESNESFEETIQRECLEETGWQIELGAMISVTHCHHLTPKPLNYSFPYPDFCQIIYFATAKRFIPDARLDDDFELGSEFRPIDVVKKLKLTPNQYILLKTALKYRKG